ncbi:hypothetical protein J6590_061209 [Homalodisca vitripennis]|nr:hypothetical protein J6590_061209 [Homalodisca vitripennis]
MAIAVVKATHKRCLTCDSWPGVVYTGDKTFNWHMSSSAFTEQLQHRKSNVSLPLRELLSLSPTKATVRSMMSYSDGSNQKTFTVSRSRSLSLRASRDRFYLRFGLTLTILARGINSIHSVQAQTSRDW